MAAPWATDTFERHKRRHPHASGISGKSPPSLTTLFYMPCLLPPGVVSLVSVDPDTTINYVWVKCVGVEGQGDGVCHLRETFLSLCPTVVGHKSQWRMQQPVISFWTEHQYLWQGCHLLQQFMSLTNVLLATSRCHGKKKTKGLKRGSWFDVIKRDSQFAGNMYVS